jgi:hypothetical protein
MSTPSGRRTTSAWCGMVNAGYPSWRLNKFFLTNEVAFLQEELTGLAKRRNGLIGD